MSMPGFKDPIKALQFANFIFVIGVFIVFFVLGVWALSLFGKPWILMVIGILLITQALIIDRVENAK